MRFTPKKSAQCDDTFQKKIRSRFIYFRCICDWSVHDYIILLLFSILLKLVAIRLFSPTHFAWQNIRFGTGCMVCRAHCIASAITLRDIELARFIISYTPLPWIACNYRAAPPSKFTDHLSHSTDMSGGVANGKSFVIPLNCMRYLIEL